MLLYLFKCFVFQKPEAAVIIFDWGSNRSCMDYGFTQLKNDTNYLSECNGCCASVTLQ